MGVISACCSEIPTPRLVMTRTYDSSNQREPDWTGSESQIQPTLTSPPRHAPPPTNRNAMPTFRDAIAIFRARAAAGEVKNRKTGKTGKFADSRIAPILTNVTAAVRRAARAFHGGRDLGEAELLDVELEPLFSTLPFHSEQAAIKDERVGPKKEASNVRLFVSVVTGFDVKSGRQPVKKTRVLGGWRPLYDAVEAAGKAGRLKDGTVKSYKRGVRRCAELMLAHGIGRPEDMPDDADRIQAMGVALKWSRKEIACVMSAYRGAADLAGLTHLPRAHEIVDRNGMGIKSLTDFPARLASAGYTGDPRTIDTLEAVKVLAPDLGHALEDVLRAGRTAGMSSTWVKFRLKAANWFVASVLRGDVPGISDEDLRTLTWLDLWIVTRDVPAPVNVVRSAQQARYGAPRGAMEHRPIIRFALDASAPRSYQNSHLHLAGHARAAQEAEAVPVYTQQLTVNIDAIWSITAAVFGPSDDATGVETSNPELWKQAEEAVRATKKAIVKLNKTRSLAGRKKKDKLPITYPQMMCMGLPYLMQRCHELREAISARLLLAGNLDSRSSIALQNRYNEALREYVVALMLCDDGLRRANYANATVGLQILPIWRRDGNGRIVGLEGLRTEWSGYDHALVKLKVDKKGYRENRRGRDITPAFLDKVLLWDFWTQTRVDFLVSAGLLESAEQYDIETDTFAFLPTPRPKPGQIVDYYTEQARYAAELAAVAAGDATVRPTPPVWRGHVSEDMLSEYFGRAVHRVCRHVLKKSDLPEDYDDPRMVEEWRGLFSGHATRLMLSCYFGGMRNNWAQAVWLTNDEEKTLRDHYIALQANFNDVMNADDWRRPTWFDAVIDRALDRHPGDDWAAFWRTFDAMRPGECLKRMVEAASKRKEPRSKRSAAVLAGR